MNRVSWVGILFSSAVSFVIEAVVRNRHEKLTQCWFDVGPPSSTPAQHKNNIGYKRLASAGQFSPASHSISATVDKHGVFIHACDNKSGEMMNRNALRSYADRLIVTPIVVYRYMLAKFEASTSSGFCNSWIITCVQSQKAVSAYFTSKQILLFGLALQCRSSAIKLRCSCCVGPARPWPLPRGKLLLLRRISTKTTGRRRTSPCL